MNARLWSACLALVLVAAPAAADYEITFSPTAVGIDPGGVTTVDVLIAETSATPNLDFYIATFRLTPVGGSPEGGVTFTVPQTNYSTDSSYVFFNNSGGLAQDVTQSGSVLTVGDLSADGAGIDVGAGRLLARINLSAIPGLAVGSAYRLELVADESEFQDVDFAPIAFVANQPATVTAIPEPGAFLLTGAVAGGGLLARLRRRRAAVVQV